MPEQIEEPLPLEDAADQCLQLQSDGRRIVLPVDRAPDLEPLLVRREQADARLQAIGEHQRRVVVHQRGKLRPCKSAPARRRTGTRIMPPIWR